MMRRSLAAGMVLLTLLALSAEARPGGGAAAGGRGGISPGGRDRTHATPAKPALPDAATARAGAPAGKAQAADLNAQLESLKTRPADLSTRMDGLKDGTADLKAGLRDGAAGSAEAKAKLAEKKDALRAKMDPAQVANLEKLKADAAGFRAASEVTPEQRAQFEADFRAALSGASKPSDAAVDGLSATVAQATADGKLGPKEVAQIQEGVNALLNDANIPDDEIAALSADVRAIAEASNMSPEDVATLAADVEAVARTAQANAAEAKGTMETVPAAAVPSAGVPPARTRPGLFRNRR